MLSMVWQPFFATKQMFNVVNSQIFNYVKIDSYGHTASPREQFNKILSFSCKDMPLMNKLICGKF